MLHAPNMIMNKKTVVVSAAFVLTACLLGGCNRKPTAVEVMTNMAKASAEVKMMDMKSELELEMNADADLLGEMSVSMVMKADSSINVQQNISHTNLDMVMNMMEMEFPVSLELYTQTEGQAVTNYIHMDDQWIKDTTELTQEESALNLELLNTAMELKDVMLLSGEMQEVDGRSCYELKATIAPEELTSLIGKYYESLGLGELQDEMALEGVNFLEVLDQKSMNFAVYVEEESWLPVKVVLEANDRMSQDGDEDTTEASDQKTEAQVEETESGLTVEVDPETDQPVDDLTEEESVSITLGKLNLEMLCNYPEVTEIVIPEEALNAEEAASFEDMTDEELMEAELLETDESMLSSLEHPEVLAEYQPGEKVFFESEELTVSALRLYQEEDSLYMDLNLENRSKDSLDVYNTAVAVNHTMMNGNLYSMVQGESSKVACIEIYPNDGQDMPKVRSITLDLEVSDTKEFQVIHNPEPTDIKLKKKDAYKVDQDDVLGVFENSFFRVTVYEPEDQEENRDMGFFDIPVCVENLTKENLGIYVESGTLGEETIYPMFFGDVFAGSCIYSSVSLDLNELLSLGKTDAADLTFGFSSYKLTDESMAAYEKSKVVTIKDFQVPADEDEEEMKENR